MKQLGKRRSGARGDLHSKEKESPSWRKEICMAHEKVTKDHCSDIQVDGGRLQGMIQLVDAVHYQAETPQQQPPTIQPPVLLCKPDIILRFLCENTTTSRQILVAAIPPNREPPAAAPNHLAPGSAAQTSHHTLFPSPGTIMDSRQTLPAAAHHLSTAQQKA